MKPAVLQRAILDGKHTQRNNEKLLFSLFHAMFQIERVNIWAVCLTNPAEAEGSEEYEKYFFDFLKI